MCEANNHFNKLSPHDKSNDCFQKHCFVNYTRSYLHGGH